MIGLVYGRDMLLSLNRGQGPSTLVKERLRRLGISVTGRRRRRCLAPVAAAGSRISARSEMTRSLALAPDNRQDALSK